VAVDLGQNLERLRKYNAQRRFKAAAKAIMAVQKMHNLIGLSNAARKVTQEEFVDDLFEEDGSCSEQRAAEPT
jgi:hypothetical protein